MPVLSEVWEKRALKSLLSIKGHMMSNKKYGKPSQLKREEREAAKKRKGSKPSSGPSVSPESSGKTEHPVMETHPGAREKPKPVRKPRARKPKPVEEPSSPTPSTKADTLPEAPTTSGDKPLTWSEDDAPEA